MRQVLFNQQDVVALAPVFRAQSRDQFQPAGTASYHYDLGLLHRAVMRCKGVDGDGPCPACMLARNDRRADRPRALPGSILGSSPAGARTPQTTERKRMSWWSWMI